MAWAGSSASIAANEEDLQRCTSDISRTRRPQPRDGIRAARFRAWNIRTCCTNPPNSLAPSEAERERERNVYIRVHMRERGGARAKISLQVNKRRVASARRGGRERARWWKNQHVKNRGTERALARLSRFSIRRSNKCLLISRISACTGSGGRLEAEHSAYQGWSVYVKPPEEPLAPRFRPQYRIPFLTATNPRNTPGETASCRVPCEPLISGNRRWRRRRRRRRPWQRWRRGGGRQQQQQQQQLRLCVSLTTRLDDIVHHECRDTTRVWQVSSKASFRWYFRWIEIHSSI